MNPHETCRRLFNAHLADAWFHGWDKADRDIYVS